MATTLAGKPGRGGISIDSKGTQRTIGFWEFPVDRPDGWLGRLRSEFSEAMKVAQRHHTMNEAQRIARASGKQPTLPEPTVRQSLARLEQKKLAEVRARTNAIAVEAVSKRVALKPFDYSDSKIIDALNRQELRSMLRSMEPEQRTAAVRRLEYKHAAFEQPAEVSGLDPSLYDALYEAEVAEKYPVEIAGTGDALAAAELCLAACKAASAAVESELIASGAPINAPAAPEPMKSWA
jgi:hypothetical protein